MNRSFRLLSVVSAFALAAVAARAADAGYVDLGKFKPAAGCEFVEVNIGTPLLKFASLFMDHDDPDAAALIKSLKHIRVNVVGLNETNRADTTAQVEKVRAELEAQGWTKMVTVREKGDTEDVAIYVKSHSDEAIDGIVVTVIDAKKGEAVFVNVVGNIKPEQLASLGRGLHIDHLDVNVKSKGV
ncbi:MAG: DUF4252 domain-containing protein [Verrucomicrobia bacterium]|nr:DUF4252 domain-containing protein [Verrucomicrobiota bacterium]